MRLLVIDKDKSQAERLAEALRKHGYGVDMAANGVDGLQRALNIDYDLISLEILLAGMDGWEVLRRLRIEKDTPVLLLTELSQQEHRIKGLEQGADDYLVKPVAFAEVLAHIRAVLRRSSDRCGYIRIGDLRIDALNHRVHRNGRRISLSPREFALLQLLARRRGSVLTRTQIISQVWGSHFERDGNLVEVAIRRLRTKIDCDHGVKLIHTVRGMGYVLMENQDSRNCMQDSNETKRVA